MSNPWFESVAVAQRRAKKRLPPSVYAALIAGSEKGVTLKDNVDAFDELRFAPRTAGGSTPTRSTSAPARARPATTAASSISPLARGSRPTTATGPTGPSRSASTEAAARATAMVP